MDDENKGKPYEQMDDLGGPPLFLETPISSQQNQRSDVVSPGVICSSLEFPISFATRLHISPKEFVRSKKSPLSTAQTWCRLHLGFKRMVDIHLSQGRSTPCIGDKLIQPLMTGILIMGPYKPLRTWVDEFIPYYMEIM